MTTDASGNVYVVGGFTGTIDLDPGPGTSNAGPAFGSDVWFGKYTSTGSLVWAFALIGGTDDFGHDIGIDNSGNVYITGYYSTSQSNLDFNPGAGTANPTVTWGFFLAKYNNNGIFQWVKTIGSGLNSELRALALEVDGSGNCNVAGTFLPSSPTGIDFDPGSGNNPLSSNNGSIFFAKYTSAGIYSWAKIVGKANAAGARLEDIARDASNNVYITGWFNGIADFHPTATTPTLDAAVGSAYICKYNSSGNFVWSKQVAGTAQDISFSCVVDASNNVYITGSQDNISDGSDNIFLAKFNSSGTQTAIASIGLLGFSDMGQSLTLDASGNVYMAGFFWGNNVNFNPLFPNFPKIISVEGFRDFFLAKYNSSLDCQWARNIGGVINFPDFEINALRFSNNKVIGVGNFTGSGDFNNCGNSTTYTASTVDAFMAGFESQSPVLAISGPNFSCVPQEQLTFTALNVPLGTTVTWTASPGSQVSPTTGSGNPFVTNILPGVTTGVVTITATVSGICGGTVQTSVSIGLPGGTCVPEIVLEPCNTLLATACSGAPQYNWYFDGVLVETTELHWASISLIVNPLSAGQHTLCVETENDCGLGPSVCTPFVTGDCGEGGQQFAMGYPNPTQATINFTMEPGSIETLSYEYTYKLIDRNGVVVKGATTNLNSIVIDVSDLPEDTYYFKVWLPNQLIQQQILIN